MSALSVRLPEELDCKLTAQAKRLHKRRSELVREAIDEYLRQQDKQRFMDDMIAEMHDWPGTSRRVWTPGHWPMRPTPR